MSDNKLISIPTKMTVEEVVAIAKASLRDVSTTPCDSVSFSKRAVQLIDQDLPLILGKVLQIHRRALTDVNWSREDIRDWNRSISGDGNAAAQVLWAVAECYPFGWHISVANDDHRIMPGPDGYYYCASFTRHIRDSEAIFSPHGPGRGWSDGGSFVAFSIVS